MSSLDRLGAFRNNKVMNLAKTSKITRILFIALPVAFVLSLVGYLLWQKYHPAKEAQVAINPVFQEIPAPHFMPVSGVSFAKDFQLVAAPNFVAPKDWPKTVKVYKIASQSGILKPKDKAVEIAKRLGFPASTSEVPGDSTSEVGRGGVIPSPLAGGFIDSQDAWIFQQGQNLLFVNKKDLSWNLEWGSDSLSSRILTQEEVKAKVLVFLKDRGFDISMVNEAKVAVQGFDSVDLRFSKPKDPANPEYWQFAWTLQKDGLEIVGSYDEAPLTATADRYGSLSKLHYGLGEIDFEIFGDYPVRSFDAALQSTQEGRGVIVEISEPGKLYSSVLGEIQSFTPQEFREFYYQDLEQGFLVPVIEFSGSATVSGKFYVAKVWITGVSGEWVR